VLERSTSQFSAQKETHAPQRTAPWFDHETGGSPWQARSCSVSPEGNLR
jgi:hypothetical protein